jgi:hypothetical protein
MTSAVHTDYIPFDAQKHWHWLKHKWNTASTLKKWMIGISSSFAVMSFSVFGGVSIGLVNITPSFAVFNSLITKAPLQAEVLDDQAWREAHQALSNFYLRLDLHRYDAARALLTPGYAQDVPAYSVAKLKEWENQKIGDIKLFDIARDTGASSNATKVISYKTKYLMTDRKFHCDTLSAFVVQRAGVWTIDIIHDEDQYQCDQ